MQHFAIFIDVNVVFWEIRNIAWKEEERIVRFILKGLMYKNECVYPNVRPQRHIYTGRQGLYVLRRALR